MSRFYAISLFSTIFNLTLPPSPTPLSISPSFFGAVHGSPLPCRSTASRSTARMSYLVTCYGLRPLASISLGYPVSQIVHHCPGSKYLSPSDCGLVSPTPLSISLLCYAESRWRASGFYLAIWRPVDGRSPFLSSRT